MVVQELSSCFFLFFFKRKSRYTISSPFGGAGRCFKDAAPHRLCEPGLLVEDAVGLPEIVDLHATLTAVPAAEHELAAEGHERGRGVVARSRDAFLPAGDHMAERAVLLEAVAPRLAPEIRLVNKNACTINKPDVAA